MFVFSLFRHTDFGTCVKRHSSAVNGTEKKKKAIPLLPSAVRGTSRKHSLVNLDTANPAEVDSRNDFKHKLYSSCFHLSHSHFLGS